MAAKDDEDYTPCQYCDDTGRMDDEENEEFSDATTDCIHCKANSQRCKGCSAAGCPGCSGKYAK